MIGESFRMSLKIRFKVINVLDPKLEPEMHMAALIQQTAEKNRFLRGITEQDKNTCHGIWCLPHNDAQTKRALLVSV